MTELRVTLPDDLIEQIAEQVVAKLGKPPEPWIDVDGAAVHLACPKSRIYDLVAQRRLECRRDGRRVLFRREWLDAAIGGA